MNRRKFLNKCKVLGVIPLVSLSLPDLLMVEASTTPDWFEIPNEPVHIIRAIREVHQWNALIPEHLHNDKPSYQRYVAVIKPRLVGDTVYYESDPILEKSGRITIARLGKLKASEVKGESIDQLCAEGRFASSDWTAQDPFDTGTSSKFCYTGDWFW